MGEGYTGGGPSAKVLERARTLTVERTGERTFAVGEHPVMVGDADLICDCRASAFGRTCSHKLAVELALSAERRRAA
jgi:hypothetical protein